ncbi:hypothetical protein P5673_020783 [Acropora cervicornis]|uniref:Uncharacterized protein n=1 Tax=Acropora cervicornis TaxID=6130 RepID=A0AAD9Q919_ACRCE|nr:hypothetical protein P5673_020783 [Acropora cervicornis]
MQTLLAIHENLLKHTQEERLPLLMLKALSYARPKAFSQSNPREKIAGNKNCVVSVQFGH